jgi:hypothetical protein
MQYRTVHYSTVQYSTVQYTTVQGHPNVREHGTYVPKNLSVTHLTSFHFNTKSRHTNYVTLLQITSLISTQSPLEFPCL